MHTMTFKDSDSVRIHYNGDYSGDIIISKNGSVPYHPVRVSTTLEKMVEIYKEAKIKEVSTPIFEDDKNSISLEFNYLESFFDKILADKIICRLDDLSHNELIDIAKILNISLC